MTIKSQNSDSEAAYLLGIAKSQMADAFKKEAGEVLKQADDLLSSVLEHDDDGYLSEQDKVAVKSALSDVKDEEKDVSEFDTSKDVSSTQGSSWDGNSNYAPISMAAGILTAFLAMIAFSNILNQLETQLSILWSQAQMGAKTKDGKVVSYDYKNSIANHWFQGQVEAGEKQADGLRAQAIGAIVGACVGAVAIVAMGVGYFKTDTSASSEQIADAKAQRDALSTADGGDIEMMNLREAPQPVRARVAEMRDGVRMEEGYQVNAKGESLDQPVEGTELTQRELNEQAVKHLRSSDEATRQKAMENAEKRLQRLEGQAQTGQNKYNSLSQFINVANTAGDSSGKAYGSWANADATSAAAKLKASSEVAQQSYQQVQNSLDKAVQSAIQNHEAANSTATSMGQALASANR